MKRSHCRQFYVVNGKDFFFFFGDKKPSDYTEKGEKV